MYKVKFLVAGLLSLAVTTTGYVTQNKRLQADKPAEDLSPEQFEKIRNLVKPAAGESRWEQIPWLLSVYDARKKAADEGKPILVWSGGGSPPLGGC